MSAILNADYTLTLNFTDGSSYTTPSLRGEKGEQGPAGPQGIQGPAGPQGERGFSGVAVATAGLVAFNVTEDGILQCSYTGDEQPDYSINSDGHLILNI